MNKKSVLFCALLSSLLLTNCAPVLVGTAAVGTTSVLVDRRNAGDVANDNVIETKSAFHLTQTNLSSSHITTTSYEGDVLLSGEVGTEDDKAKAGEIVSSINGVKSVYNELAVMPNSSITTRMNDSVLAGKVRAALIDTKGITLNSVKVTVDRNICYLMGAVTENEAKIITDVASRVTGIKKVVRLFKIISDNELEKRTVLKDNQGGDGNSDSENSSGSNQETQTFPIS